MTPNKFKFILRTVSRIIILVKNFSISISFLIMTALYPLIMYKLEVEYVPVLKIPSYAFAALFFIYSIKTINTLLSFSDIDLIKKINEKINE